MEIRFVGTVTHDETFTEPLPHQRLVELHTAVVGTVPSNGLGRDEVLQQWDKLEDPLTTETSRRLNV